MRIEPPLQIEHDGTRLFAVTAGSGPDVVLLHPTPVHHAFWLPVADQLADRYRLTLIDLRGHGKSSAGTGKITMAQLAEDVHAVLAASGHSARSLCRLFHRHLHALRILAAVSRADGGAGVYLRQASTGLRGQSRNSTRVDASCTATRAVWKNSSTAWQIRWSDATARQHHPEIRTAARDMMNSCLCRRCWPCSRA